MLIDLQPVDQEVEQQVSKVPTLVITRMALKLRTFSEGLIDFGCVLWYTIVVTVPITR